MKTITNIPTEEKNYSIVVSFKNTKRTQWLAHRRYSL
jgi:hypothetical protein